MSSKKVWYIFLGNHHKGPYTLSEIDSLILQGHAPFDVPIWKDGLDGWVSHSTLSKHLRDPDQDLPDLPNHLKLDYLDIPPIPTDAQKSPLRLPVKKIVQVECEVKEIKELGDNILCKERDSDLDNLLPTNEWKPWKFIKYLAIILSLFIMVAGVTFYFHKYHHFSRPSLLSVSEHRKLLTVFSGSSDEINAEFALSKDLSIIWMSSNYPFASQVYLTAKSIDGKIIGDQAVEFISSGFIKDGLSSFSKINFKKGEKVFPGKYLFSVVSVDRPKLKWWQELLGIKDNLIKVEREVLVGFNSQIDFESTIKKYHHSNIKKKIDLLTELQYKYQTVVAVANQLEEQIKKLILEKRDLRAIKKFESEYTVGTGTFLTSLMAQNEGAFAIEFEKYSSFKDIFSQLHKDAGELANSSMEIVDKIKSAKLLNQKARDELNKLLSLRILECKKSCYQVIYKIQGELQNLRAQMVD